MKEHKVVGDYHGWTLDLLKDSPLFSGLSDKDLDVVVTYAKLCEYESQEIVLKEGDFSDSFYLILEGEASVMVTYGETEELIELGRIAPMHVVGEMGILLDYPRSATVMTMTHLWALRFASSSFELMLEQIPGFARQLCTTLAGRLLPTLRWVPIPDYEEDKKGIPPANVLTLLPALFLQRHRVLPLEVDGNSLSLGFVYDPGTDVVKSVRRMLPGTQLRLFRITQSFFEQCLKMNGALLDLEENEGGKPVVVGVLANSRRDIYRSSAELPKIRFPLGTLLGRMLAEGASDLHLPAGRKPHWRIGDEVFRLSDIRSLGEEEVFDIFKKWLPSHAKQEFEEQSQCDFSFNFAQTGRCRVHLFRDENGICAVLRLFALQIPTCASLRLPPAVRRLIKIRQGLVLMTGPNGFGKTTTLSALLNEINQQQRKHILSIESPIEYLHQSVRSLVTQREVGAHISSIEDGLRTAVKEDADVVFAGVLSSPEEWLLALKTAESGRLVFGILDNNECIEAIDSLVEMFPPLRRSYVCSMLADQLRAICRQVLCQRNGGGRIAAFEVFYSGLESAQVIRNGKLPRFDSEKGHLELNQHLSELVSKDEIDWREAFRFSRDIQDLQKRFRLMGLNLPAQEAWSEVPLT